MIRDDLFELWNTSYNDKPELFDRLVKNFSAMHSDRDRWQSVAQQLAEAMERSVREGFTDHLDDGGEFWYAALSAFHTTKGEG